MIIQFLQQPSQGRGRALPGGAKEGPQVLSGDKMEWRGRSQEPGWGRECVPRAGRTGVQRAGRLCLGFQRWNRLRLGNDTVQAVTEPVGEAAQRSHQ